MSLNPMRSSWSMVKAARDTIKHPAHRGMAPSLRICTAKAHLYIGGTNGQVHEDLPCNISGVNKLAGDSSPNSLLDVCSQQRHLQEEPEQQPCPLGVVLANVACQVSSGDQPKLNHRIRRS